MIAKRKIARNYWQRGRPPSRRSLCPRFRDKRYARVAWTEGGAPGQETFKSADDPSARNDWGFTRSRTNGASKKKEMRKSAPEGDRNKFSQGWHSIPLSTSVSVSPKHNSPPPQFSAERFSAGSMGEQEGKVGTEQQPPFIPLHRSARFNGVAGSSSSSRKRWNKPGIQSAGRVKWN